MTSLEQMNAKIKDLASQRAQIFEQIKPLQEKAISLYQNIQELNEAITVKTLKSEQSEQDRFDFLMAESGFCSDTLRYNTANTIIRDMGLYMSGYCEFSQQRSAEVFIYKFDGGCNEKSIEAIKKLIELFKPMDKEGNKTFKVFCEDYTIFAHPDNTFSLRKRRFQNDFSTLEELFAYYIDNCHCYDDKEGGDN